MKKIFILLALAFVLASCDNGDMETGPKEPNPYPDGVYPFKVSNIRHSSTASAPPVVEIIVTWDNPDDKDFRRVTFEALGTTSNGDFSLFPDDVPFIVNNTFVLGANSLTMNITYGAGNNKYVILRCVDRFGNISEGVRHDIPWEYN